MAWAPDYCSTSELKAYLRIPSGDTDDDTELGLAITAASRAIDRATNRQFGATATTEERTFPGVYDRHRGLYVVEIDDVMTSVGLVVTTASGTTFTGHTLRPVNGPQKGQPWTELTATASLTGDVVVEATWGWSAVPDTIKQAALLQSSRFFNRRISPFGVAGSPDLGSELRLLAKVDPDVEVMIGAYRRWWAAR